MENYLRGLGERKGFTKSPPIRDPLGGWLPLSSCAEEPRHNLIAMAGKILTA
jgi:hypothetical protein